MVVVGDEDCGKSGKALKIKGKSVPGRVWKRKTVFHGNKQETFFHRLFFPQGCELSGKTEIGRHTAQDARSVLGIDVDVDILEHLGEGGVRLDLLLHLLKRVNHGRMVASAEFAPDVGR